MKAKLPADVLTLARSIRSDLVARKGRDLAGQCALASMRIAEGLGDIDVFRVGFFMRRETFLGRRGRYPNPHAWCQIGSSIVDVTATQFGRFPAVYVVPATDTDRYIECSDGAQAIREVMREWLLDRLPEYRQLRRRLRALDHAVA